MSLKKLLFLTHQHSVDICSVNFFWRYCTQFWEQQGYQIAIAQGIREVIPADILFVHVDLTVVPDDYLAYTRYYPVNINGKVKDISRTAFSRHLVTHKDEYDAPVIIKTNANCGGAGELFIARNVGQAPEMPSADKLWQEIQYLNSTEYPIFRSPKTVPEDVWDNPHLVVEKFLPERLPNGDFCLRTYLFLGDKEIGIAFISKDPIIKFSNASSRYIFHEIPEALRQWRYEMGFDYGRFDYSMVQGKPILFDANKTPGDWAKQCRIAGQRRTD